MKDCVTVTALRGVVIFSLFGALMSHSPREYTNSFAVEVVGNKDDADKLASKLGFKNHGRVSCGRQGLS